MEQNRDINQAGLPNVMSMTCLRPNPGTIDDFMMLWNERNKTIEERDRHIEAKFAAVARGDMGAVKIHGDAADAALLCEEELSRRMRPLQFQAWAREEKNVVTNVGRNDILDKYWRGAAYTQTVVMGLKGTGAPAAGDTQASHATWLEVGLANAPTYTGNRKAVTMGAASAQSSVSPQQTYAITSTGTVSGMFMNNGGLATKDDTTGVLVSAVNFTGGDEAVNNLDSLLVTYTFNA